MLKKFPFNVKKVSVKIKKTEAFLTFDFGF
jgi:hypothetical protein